jgi:hypothetical protein
MSRMTATTALTEPPSPETPQNNFYPSDPDLLAQVLEVYVPTCRYLLSADVTARDDGDIEARCEFAIPNSFYIAGTGHFNAVEFNLCYNQMMYYVFAKIVAAGLVRALRGWTLNDYWQRQLPDFLIVDFHSSFQKSIDAHGFHGEIVVGRTRTVAAGRNWAAMLLAETTCRYWDDAGGRSTGTVRMALTNPPEPPQPAELLATQGDPS